MYDEIKEYINDLEFIPKKWKERINNFYDIFPKREEILID